jgi:hypothetical protein
MKITPLRMAVPAFAAIAMLFIGSNQASASVNVGVGIQVGTPPPPFIVEHPWGRPYRGAVWIPGHHEWVNGAWIWVGGYYAYPPHHGAYWVPARYHHGYYYPGHWA